MSQVVIPLEPSLKAGMVSHRLDGAGVLVAHKRAAEITTITTADGDEVSESSLYHAVQEALAHGYPTPTSPSFLSRNRASIIAATSGALFGSISTVIYHTLT